MRRIMVIIGVAMATAILGASLLALFPALWRGGVQAQGDHIYENCPGGDLRGSLIGGDFTLFDQTGRPFSLGDLRGAPALIYFGYTFCPDVCPVDVATISEAAQALEARGVMARPVFVTLDPERDTQQALADYASNFHPRMAALRGDEDQTRAAAKAWRIYYKSNKGREGEDEFYTVDHSTMIYYLSPGGEAQAFFPNGAPVAEIVEGVTCRLGVDG